MAKIDRLGWAAGAGITAYGVRIGIRVSREEAVDLLTPHLPPGWKPLSTPGVEQLFSLRLAQPRREGVREYNLLYSGVVRRARSLELPPVLEQLGADLRQTVATRSRRLVFVHAGVVGWKGRAILIPGRSLAGKSTLVAELLKAGATYYSDEFAVLDGRGRVHPFAKRLALREAGRGTRNVRFEELGGVAGEGALPVGLIALAQYKAGARWRPVRPSLGHSLLALFAHTAPIRSRPEVSIATLQRALVRAVVLKGVRGEARETAEALLRTADRLFARGEPQREKGAA